MLKLKDTSLDWALTHIEKFGDTNIFPIPFEFEAIRFAWDSDIKPYLLSQDILSWTVRPYRRCLTPKHKFGFRISTQLDPLDSIVFTALVGEIGDDIEKSRIGVDENICFSSRFKLNKDGRMYDKDINFQSFQNYSEKLVSTKKYKYVVVADIADFFPRIYSHPLENAIQDCTKKANHAIAIKNMLKGWNYTVSIGIPVGISATMLLSELVLDDVDRGLRDESSIHCRYVDDFRIFCESEKEAYEKLTLLANLLYENHALTLQQNKTKIVPKDLFKKIYLQSESKLELNSLSDKLRQILEDMGIEDPYEEIEYDLLADEYKQEIDSLNLIEILKEQIENNELDMPIIKFVLRRLSQFDNLKALDVVLKNIDKLYPVFTDVIRYVQGLRSLNEEAKHKIGQRLLTLLEASVVGHLEFHRLWIFNTFSKSTEWDNESEFIKLFKKYPDPYSRRELILALGSIVDPNFRTIV